MRRSDFVQHASRRIGTLAVWQFPQRTTVRIVVRDSRSPAWPDSTRLLRSPATLAAGTNLAKAGSPHLRWALVEAAVHAHRPTAPDVDLYRATRGRRSATVAKLTVARKIGKRVFHTLRELERNAA